MFVADLTLCPSMELERVTCGLPALISEHRAIRRNQQHQEDLKQYWNEKESVIIGKLKTKTYRLSKILQLITQLVWLQIFSCDKLVPQ